MNIILKKVLSIGMTVIMLISFVLALLISPLARDIEVNGKIINAIAASDEVGGKWELFQPSAQGEIEHIVLFRLMLEDGTYYNETQFVLDGEKCLKPANPFITGKEFIGWYTENEKPFDFDTPITDDVTLTAKFDDIPAPDIIITFWNGSVQLSQKAYQIGRASCRERV